MMGLGGVSRRKFFRGFVQQHMRVLRWRLVRSEIRIKRHYEGNNNNPKWDKPECIHNNLNCFNMAPSSQLRKWMMNQVGRNTCATPFSEKFAATLHRYKNSPK
jgi:hypothetical protein